MNTGERPEPAEPIGAPPRRTQFAEERTLLAWWRTGIASAAVALGVGGLLPKLGDLPRARFVARAVGYGVLVLAFVIDSAFRAHLSRQALARGGFSRQSGWTIGVLAGYISAGRALVALALVLGIWALLFGMVEIIGAFAARHARGHWDQVKEQLGA